MKMLSLVRKVTVAIGVVDIIVPMWGEELDSLFGVTLHLQIQAPNQDPQILVLHVISNKYTKNRVFSNTNPRNSSIHPHFDLSKSNPMPQFSLLQRSDTKKAQRNGKLVL